MALLISTRWHLLATIMREEQSDHWLTFQLWIMGIYLHASVHLPPVCLSCLNQRLGSATSALSPSCKGMAPHKRLTTGDIYSRQSLGLPLQTLHTHQHEPATWPGRQGQVGLKELKQSGTTVIVRTRALIDVFFFPFVACMHINGTQLH